MVGCRAAAAAYDVHAAGQGGFPDGFGHLSGQFVILAHSVGQAGVWIADHGKVANAGEVFYQGHQPFCSERAVEAEGQKGIVPDCGQECFDRLSGQGPSGAVAGRDGDDGRKAGAYLRERVQRGFRIEGVEAGLDEDQIHAAFDQCRYLLAVDFCHLVECQRQGCLVGQAGAEGQRFCCRSDAAGHPYLVPFAYSPVCLAPGDTGPLAGELSRPTFQAVFPLRDAVAAEGVGLDDVGAGLDIGAVDRCDQFRFGKVECIEVAAFPVALQHRTHRSVEQQDPFTQGQPDGIVFFHVAKIRYFEKKRRRKRASGLVFHYI